MSDPIVSPLQEEQLMEIGEMTTESIASKPIVWDVSPNGRFGTSGQGELASPYGFEETVARLIALSGQDPTRLSDHYKVSVEFVGALNGEVFTLYDYKCSEELHIGGRSGLDVAGLNSELVRLLATVDPVPFTAKHYYEGKGTYRWPCEAQKRHAL